MLLYKTTNPSLQYHPSVVSVPFELYSDSDTEFNCDEALEEVEIINHIVKQKAKLTLIMKWEPRRWMPLNPRFSFFEIPQSEKSIRSAFKLACQDAFRYEPNWQFRPPTKEKEMIERIWDANGECELELTVKVETDPYTRQRRYYSLPMKVDGKFTTLLWMMKDVVKQAILEATLAPIDGHLSMQLNP